MAVLPGKRVRDNSIFGTLTGALTSGSTSMASTNLDDLSTIAGDHAIITLDPFRQFGDPEIVMVTSHPVSATTAVIQRGMYNTVARSHGIGVQWAHAATVEDFADVVTSSTRPADQYEGQVIYQTDTDSFLYWDGANWRTLGAGAPGFLDYKQVTTNQAGIGAGFNVLTGLASTVTVAAGRRIKISAQGVFSQQTAGGSGILAIFQDGVRINEDAYTTTTNSIFSGNPSAVVTPSAGNHTYDLRAQFTAGTGTLLGDPEFPAFILVQDITGSESPQGPSSVPVGMLAQAFVTANQGSIGAATDVTGLSVNVAVTAGRTLRISTKVEPSINTTGDQVNARIFRDGTQIQECPNRLETNGGAYTFHFDVTDSPTAGAHVYKVQLGRDTGAGTVTNNASATSPSYILVEDITPTPTIASNTPSSTLGYAEVVANQGTITAEVDLTGLSVSVTVGSGRRIRVTGEAFLKSTAADNTGIIRIKEGATVLQLSQEVMRPANIGNKMNCAVVLTPTAGSHTYKLSAEMFGGGTGQMDASIQLPAYILVEDITGVTFPILTLSPGGRHAVAAKRITSDQALVSNAFTAVVFNGVDYNENSAYSTTTGIYTIPEDGLYTIKACVRVATATPPFFAVLSLFKNGGAFRRGDLSSQSVDNGAQFMIGVENKFVVGDQLTLQVFIGAGETSPIIERVSDTGDFNWMSIRRVGPI